MSLDHTFQVPTVNVHTDMFLRVTRSVVRVNGMPKMRQVYVPQPVMGKTPAQLRAYVDGTDPISGRPVMQEVVEGLTRPFAAEDLHKATWERSTPRLVAPEREANLHELFLANDWTDKLPI